MPGVLIFKETLLQPSETFILAQTGALKEYAPVLAGLERAHPSLPLPHEPILLSRRGWPISDFRAKLYRRTGIAPSFHRKAKQPRPALIHAHFATGGRTALPLARELGVPLLVTLHGFDVTFSGIRQEQYKRLAEEASLFVCVSEFIRNCALALGFPAEKLITHYIGIDRELFAPGAPARPRGGILFVGRLIEKKGCEYLLRAMKRVQGAHPGCEVTIVGDGPLRPGLEALARELGIRCKFRGVQPASVVRECLQEAKIFCVPSVTAANGDSEGLGMVFAEAQAMGVPVVSTKHGGIPEVVASQETGLLATERDIEALADALVLLLSDEDLWQRFHRAAQQRVEKHFDLTAQTKLLEKIYKTVATSE